MSTLSPAPVQHLYSPSNQANVTEQFDVDALANKDNFPISD